MKVDIYIREADYKDINFIKNSWEKSFEKVMKQVPQTLYTRGQQRLMAKLMARSTCFVACNPDELTQIYGWMLFEKLGEIGVLHYIYVKHPYRRYGIGSQLYSMLERDKSVPCIATHTTLYLNHIKDKWNLTFNPYILLGD